MSILTSYETVIIAKIVILKARILNDLDRQPSKFRNLEKKNSSNEKLRKILKRFLVYGAIRLYSELPCHKKQNNSKFLVLVCLFFCRCFALWQ